MNAVPMTREQFLADRAAGRTDFSGMNMLAIDLSGMNLTLLTAPLVAVGVSGVRTASDFDSAMAMISARTGLVGDDLNQIRDLALQLGADTAFSAQSGGVPRIYR